jgi:hypothetical protein
MIVGDGPTGHRLALRVHIGEGCEEVLLVINLVIILHPSGEGMDPLH